MSRLFFLSSSMHRCICLSWSSWQARVFTSSCFLFATTKATATATNHYKMGLSVASKERKKSGQQILIAAEQQKERRDEDARQHLWTTGCGDFENKRQPWRVPANWDYPIDPKSTRRWVDENKASKLEAKCVPKKRKLEWKCSRCKTAEDSVATFDAVCQRKPNV